MLVRLVFDRRCFGCASAGLSWLTIVAAAKDVGRSLVLVGLVCAGALRAKSMVLGKNRGFARVGLPNARVAF